MGCRWLSFGSFPVLKALVRGAWNWWTWHRTNSGGARRVVTCCSTVKLLEFSGSSICGSKMERKSQQLDDPPDVRQRGKNHEAALCAEENSTHRPIEGSSTDSILEPRHKIFLSHSGVQKEFVEHLCEALERRFYYPFFDRRWSSLPKGERFPPLILEAAKQCEMAIVVVSEEYFMSKWPMIELNAFVQAIKQKSNSKLKILPLFYGLSISEFCEERRREEWYKKWESFANEDAWGRIKVDEWQDALDMLGSFNGISYNRESKEIVAFENAIVSYISESIQLDIKWNDSHVQGKSNMCEVIYKKIQEIGPSERYSVKVVGIYGVGGVGKTTMCKTLCNELMNEYEGRVCHIEFESRSTSSKELLDKALVSLTTTSFEVLQQMNEHKCMDILRRTLQRQRTFLAVDNVWDDHESIKLAKEFLKGPFHKGSLVVVTSRSLGTLELLGLHKDASFEVPDLGVGDAMNLFVYHAAGGKEFAKKEDKRDILECINRCYFCKGDGQSWHYHPLAVEVLGLQLGCVGDEPSEWVKNLFKVKNFSYLSGENPVFGILRSSFDLLPPSEQSLFMDVTFYPPDIEPLSHYECSMKEWLCLLHKQDKAEMMIRLDRLRRRGLLQDVDLEFGRVSMHDLYVEFAELEVRGKLGESRDLESRLWAYVENGDLSELESTPGGGSSHKLIRLGIWFEGDKNRIERLEGINWQYCSNVVVLKLCGGILLRGGALSLEPLKCLRSFDLCKLWGLDRVEGLEGLKNLTYFKWVNRTDSAFGRVESVQTRMGRFPASLVILEIMNFEMLFEPDVLGRCTKLCRLLLNGIQADNLDLSNCSSLQSVSLVDTYDLRTLSWLTAGGASGLRSLRVVECWNLVEIPGLEQLVGLERLEWEVCRSVVQLQLDLQKLTKLQVLKISGKQFSSLCLPRQLRELHFGTQALTDTLKVKEALKANGLEQLQVLDLSCCLNLTGLESLGDLPALRRLNLSAGWEGKILSGLPDLSQSTNLEELDLEGCGGELNEEDICMLARLPLLQPVPIGTFGRNRLDIVRRKVLTIRGYARDWSVGWEERDLGDPPYRIDRGFIWNDSEFDELERIWNDSEFDLELENYSSNDSDDNSCSIL